MSVNSLLYTNKIALNAGTINLSATESGGNLVAPIITSSNVLCANVYVARAQIADNFSGNITGDADLTGWLAVSANLYVGTDIDVDGNIDAIGWINSDANISVGTDLTVGGDATISGNIQVTGWIDSDANISATGDIQTAAALISTVSTGTAPLTVSSTTRVTNLNAATCGTADVANALKSATTTIDVSAATAPTSGQVLTATSDALAIWSDPTSPTGNIDLTNITGDLITANSFVLNDGMSGLGNIDVSGWINSDANISTGTSLSVGTDASITGNLQVTGWIDSDANISATGDISTAAQFVSTVSTGTAPLVIASTTEVSNLNAATATLSDATDALKSATTTIDVSAATAPTSGQVLTASSSTVAAWSTPATAAGSIAQIESTNFLVAATDINSTGTTMPYLTLPVITDGTQFMSVSITPTSATSLLKVEAQMCYYCVDAGVGRDVMALFDGNTNALQTDIDRRYQLNDQANMSITYLMTAGTTSAITFTIRAGNNSGNGLRTVYGGLPNTFLMITEITQ